MPSDGSSRSTRSWPPTSSGLSSRAPTAATGPTAPRGTSKPASRGGAPELARCSRGRATQRPERVLTGVVVFGEVPSAALREHRVALVGTRRDELVAGLQALVAARPVEVAAASTHGEHVEA